MASSQVRVRDGLDASWRRGQDEFETHLGLVFRPRWATRDKQINFVNPSARAAALAAVNVVKQIPILGKKSYENYLKIM